MFPRFRDNACDRCADLYVTAMLLMGMRFCVAKPVAMAVAIVPQPRKPTLSGRSNNRPGNREAWERREAAKHGDEGFARHVRCLGSRLTGDEKASVEALTRVNHKTKYTSESLSFVIMMLRCPKRRFVTLMRRFFAMVTTPACNGRHRPENCDRSRAPSGIEQSVPHVSASSVSSTRASLVSTKSKITMPIVASVVRE